MSVRSSLPQIDSKHCFTNLTKQNGTEKIDTEITIHLFCPMFGKEFYYFGGN